MHFFYHRPILFKEVLHCLPSMMPIQWDPQKNKVYYFDLAFGSTICCCFSSWKLKLFRAVIYENVPGKKWNKQIKINQIVFILFKYFFDYSDTHCEVSAYVCIKEHWEKEIMIYTIYYTANIYRIVIGNFICNPLSN